MFVIYTWILEFLVSGYGEPCVLCFNTKLWLSIPAMLLVGGGLPFAVVPIFSDMSEIAKWADLHHKNLNLQGIAMVSVVGVEVKLAFHCVGWGSNLKWVFVEYPVLCSYYDVTHLLFLWYDLVLKDFKRAGLTWETSYIHWHILHSILSTVIAGHQKLLDLCRFTSIFDSVKPDSDQSC